MEVFLQSETMDFIMLLFNTLENKSYLKDAAAKVTPKQVTTTVVLL
jgi:hypothetical protein